MKTNSRIPNTPRKSFSSMNHWFNKMYLSGLLYHPDDPAEIIINITTGLPTFTPTECVKLNKSVDLMFEYHGNKVYEVGLRYMQKAMGITPTLT